MSIPNREHGEVPLRSQAAQPLHGIKIVSCEAQVALPFGTQILADFGADVIHIEHADYREDSAQRWRLRTGRHKRRIAIDLRNSRGQDIVRQLATRADVFGENFRPGVMDSYKLGYKDLSIVNPKLIYVSVSGFGHEDILASPLRNLACYGPIGEAMGGVADSAGVRAGGNKTMGFGDIVTSIFAMLGVMVALRARDRTGVGQYVDLCLTDCLLATNERAMLMHVLACLQEVADGPKEAPMQSGWGIHDVPAKDGRFIVALINFAHWTKFCGVLGHPEWIDDPRLANKGTRKATIEQLVLPAVYKWASGKTKVDCARALQDAELAAAPVLTPEDILKEPHMAARRMLVDVIDEHGESLKVVGNPIKLSRVEANREEAVVHMARPGQHTVEVLKAELAMSTAQIDELLASGVIRA